MNNEVRESSAKQESLEAKGEARVESPAGVAETLQAEVASETAQKKEEIASLEQMMADMGADLDDEAKAVMQEQIDALKVELRSMEKAEQPSLVRPIDLRSLGTLEIKNLSSGDGVKGRHEAVVIGKRDRWISGQIEMYGYKTSYTREFVETPQGIVASKLDFATDDGHKESLSRVFDEHGWPSGTIDVVDGITRKRVDVVNNPEDGEPVSVTLQEFDESGEPTMDLRVVCDENGTYHETGWTMTNGKKENISRSQRGWNGRQMALSSISYGDQTKLSTSKSDKVMTMRLDT